MLGGYGDSIVYVKMLGFNILLKRMADSVSNITGCGCALTRLANPQCILVGASGLRSFARTLNLQDLYPHLAMCRHMSTSILNYIYIHVYVCVYVLPHPLSFQFNCAIKDLPHISYFGARIPGFGLSQLFVPPGALACVSSGRTLRTAHVPIVHIIPCK